VIELMDSFLYTDFREKKKDLVITKVRG
jgi:hypothetical protein